MYGVDRSSDHLSELYAQHRNINKKKSWTAQRCSLKSRGNSTETHRGKKKSFFSRTWEITINHFTLSTNYFISYSILYVTTKIYGFQTEVSSTKVKDFTPVMQNTTYRWNLQKLLRKNSWNRSHILCNDIPERKPIFQLQFTFYCYINCSTAALLVTISANTTSPQAKRHFGEILPNLQVASKSFLLWAA